MTIPADLDERIPIQILLGHKIRRKNFQQNIKCDHPYNLVKDGFNEIKNGRKQRYKCNKCDSRLEQKVLIAEQEKYVKKIKEIFYELFILKFPLSGVAKQYGIPQPKLSTFKKRVIREAYSQNRDVLERPTRRLPEGIMFADETYFGSRKNYNSEVEFVSNNSEFIAAGPVEKKNLDWYIKDVFFEINESVQRRLKVFVSDGEDAYKSLIKSIGEDIIHIQQIHDPRRLGTVLVNKYERSGPHWLHYQIKTNWKAFCSGKHELTFDWSIKLIRGKMYSVRGRPNKSKIQEAWRQWCGTRWRQKYEKYKSHVIPQNDTAKVFVNPETNKVSLRADSRKWMIKMLTPLLKIFKGKHVTSNIVEGKHSQIKSHGLLRKQQDPIYQHQEFVFRAYITEHGHLPQITLHGRYLWKYLIKPKKKEIKSYDLWSNGCRFTQSSLMAFV